MTDEAVTTTDRGFQHMEPLLSTYGGGIKVYESSNASGPHVWVRVEQPGDLNDQTSPFIEAVAHLTLENAARLRDQLTHLVATHYQLDGSRD